MLKQLAAQLNLPFYCFAASTTSINHIALLSKYPLKDVRVIPGMQNAGIIAIAKTELGDISLACVHLTPNTEDTRLAEITTVLSQRGNYKNKVILGDLNSISPENCVKSYHSSQILEQPRYDVVEQIRNAGFVDIAIITEKEQQCTVPVTKDNDIIFYDLRLDYIFLSHALVERAIDYHVVVNEITRNVSDHYPIKATLR